MAKGGFPKGMSGFGGGNMMRQQAQMQQKILKMQKEIEAAQQKVEETLFTASVGGGAVKAVCSGKKELTELHISHDVLSPEDAEAVEAFWEEFHQIFNKDNALAKKELCAARKLMRQVGKPWVKAGAIELEGKFLAIALGEVCGDTLICHIEKGLPQYEGVYPTMVQSFAACFAQGLRWINREDDAGDPGLRTSKLSYHPVALLEKYTVTVDEPCKFCDLAE